MTGKRSLETQRCSRDTLGDLNEVCVGKWRVGPSVDTTAERGDIPAVSKSVEMLVTHTGLLGVAVGKGLAKSFSECEMAVNAHGRKSYPPDSYMGTISSPAARSAL